MSNIGDMVISIVGDTTNFNASIDTSGRKWNELTSIISKSVSNITTSFKNIDNEAKLWGNSIDLVKQKQLALKNEMSSLMAQGFDPMGKKIQALKQQYFELGKEQGSFTDKMKSLSSTLGKVGVGLTIGVTTPLIMLGKAAVQSAAQMEMYTTSFEVMLASKSQAVELTKKVIALAAVTPFNVPEVMDATKMLLQYGVSVNDVLPMVRQLGDASGGMKDKFQSLVLAFSQMQAAGKVLSQDLRQMATAGFNPLKAISDTTGESMNSLTKRMEQGKVGIDEVNKAMVAITSVGGRFYQGMEKGSLTLSGLFSTLQDNIGITGRSLVNDFIPPMKELVTNAILFTQKLTTLDSGTKTFVLTLVGLAMATGPVITGLSGVIKTMVAMQVYASLAGKTMLASFGPGALWVVGLAAIAVAVALIVTNISNTNREAKALANAMENVNDIETLNLAIKATDTLIKQEKDKVALGARAYATTEVYNKALKKVADLENQRLDLGKRLAIVIKFSGEMTVLAAKEEIDWAKKELQAKESIIKQFEAIDKNEQWAIARHEEYNALEEKKKALLEVTNKMRLDGFTLEGNAIQGLLSQYDDIIEGIKDIDYAYIESHTSRNEMLQEELANTQVVTNEIVTTRDEALNAMGRASEHYTTKELASTNELMAEKQRMTAKELSIIKYLASTNELILEKRKTSIEQLQIIEELASTAELENEKKRARGSKTTTESIKTDYISLAVTVSERSVAIAQSLKTAFESDNVESGLIDTTQLVLSYFGSEGKIASAIIEVGQIIWDYMNGVNKKMEADAKKSAEEQKKHLDEVAKAYQDNAKLIKDLNSNIISQELTNLDTTTQASINAIRATTNARLVAAGFLADTEMSNRQMTLDDLKKSLLTEDDLTKKQQIQRNIIIAEGAIEQQKVLDNAVNDKIKLEEKLATVKKNIAIAQAKIDMTNAIAQAKIAYVGIAANPVIADIKSMYGDLLTLLGDTSIPDTTNNVPGTSIPVSSQPLARGLSASAINNSTSQLPSNNTSSADTGNIQLIVNLDSKPFLDTIFPATKNRTVLISQGAVV